VIYLNVCVSTFCVRIGSEVNILRSVDETGVVWRINRPEDGDIFTLDSAVSLTLSVLTSWTTRITPTPPNFGI